MFNRISFIILFILAFASVSFAQNTNSSTTTTRPRTTPKATTPAAPARDETPAPTATAKPPARAKSAQQGAASQSVTEAFDALLDGIRKADVKIVTGIYWNSPRLILFNNNGTVTRGWEQMRKNRESSYPEIKDVTLDVRDLHVEMLGRDGAVVTCLWTQTQTYRGQQDTASGRMTLVFRRVGGAWKAVHLHTSPDAPDPSRVLPSEQTPTTTPTTTPAPKATP